MTLAIIGGTGFDEFENLEGSQTHEISTSWGKPSDKIEEGILGNKKILLLRRHGRQLKFPPHLINYRANIAALRELGASAIIATAAVGGIAAEVGKIVLPDQIIDYTYGRESTFFEGGDTPLKHIDFSYPYDKRIREKIISAATAKSIILIESGTYGATQGPRLETAAEIQKLRKDGCHIVGMTGMPEACLAKEMEIPYATMAIVVNPAAGLCEGEILLSDMEKILSQGYEICMDILKTVEL